ncbi:MAG TPA: rhodanese-like domain-containing protein [Nitrospirota bacterium]|nr:rhodanese-like domain-containing protein [Nitrospirota bacterium]
MLRKRVFLWFLFGFILLSSSPAIAQFPIINAEDVKAWMAGKRSFVLIDTRLPDEYQAGHISGAINIPAERMNFEAARLPKNKTTPIIFYCRGTG